MSRPRNLTDEWLDGELDDLEGAEIDLPARMQAGWGKSDGLRKMPRERDPEHPAKPHRVRKHSTSTS